MINKAVTTRDSQGYLFHSMYIAYVWRRGTLDGDWRRQDPFPSTRSFLLLLSSFELQASIATALWVVVVLGTNWSQSLSVAVSVCAFLDIKELERALYQRKVNWPSTIECGDSTHWLIEKGKRGEQHICGHILV
jgi:hypothetical protein